MKTNFLIMFFLPLLFVSACSKVSMPEKDLKVRLNYNDSIAKRYALDYQWWKVYNDPQLNYFVDIALANNIDLAQAAIRVNKAMYQAKLIGADLLPSFAGKLDASAKRNIDESAPSLRSAGASVTVSYELDLWRKLADSASAAAWEHRATIEDLESARLALIANVVDAYYSLAYLNDSVLAAETNVKTYSSISAKSSIKYKVGKTTSIDYTQSEQSLLSAQSTLISLENQRKNAEANLRNLLNIGPEVPLDISTASLNKMVMPKVDLNIPLAVLANRPDLKAAEFRLHSAFSDVKASEKNWLPSISLSSALASGGGALKSMFNAPSASGALTINLPFLDWNKVYWKLRISEADFENTRLNFEKTLAVALNEVDTNYYNYNNLLKSLSTNEKRLANDLRISNYYAERYKNGAGEISDWLGALATANNSRLNTLKAKYEAAAGAAALYRALGGKYS